jgi:hypothetical protein
VTTVALLAPLAAFGVVLNAAACSSSSDGGEGIHCLDSHYLPLRRNLPAALDQRRRAAHVDFSFVLDQLSLVMLLVVTGVGFLIHVYSVGYMSDDEGYARYFSYLNLFCFS